MSEPSHRVTRMCICIAALALLAGCSEQVRSRAECGGAYGPGLQFVLCECVVLNEEAVDCGTKESDR